MPLQITLNPNELNEFIKVDPGFDEGPIKTMFDAAVLEAEQFLNTDFSTTVINEDGSTTTTPNEAPATVKEWVLSRVSEKYENRGSFKKPDFSGIQPYRVYPFRG